jgi:Spy/CpxP family protein refolding chaperone
MASDLKEWKVILATLVIFGTGVVTGGLLVHLTQRPPGRLPPPFGVAQPPMGQPGPFGQRPPPNEQRVEFLRHITRQLELTSEQRDAIERILRESQQRTKALWEPVAAKMTEELRKTDNRIRDVLTPEQRQKFDDMRSRMREARPDRMIKRTPPGENPPGDPPPPNGQRPPPPPPPGGSPSGPQPRPLDPIN